MKAIFLLAGLCCCSVGQAQQTLHVQIERITDGAALYATNDANCPITLQLALELDNCRSTINGQPLFVVAPKARHIKICSIYPIDKSVKWNYSFQQRLFYGNLLTHEYDSLYEYALPYEKGNSFELIQGYNGSFSHQQKNALDFLMDEGTPVLASRGGVVVKVIQEFTRGCPQDSCRDANLVTILHQDGTMATYAHLRYKGAAVKEWDTVKKGDLLGYSGNTGFSSVPHLHFHCILPDSVNSPMIKTKFLVAKDSPAVYLEASKFYKRDD